MNSIRRRSIRQKYIQKRLRQLDGQLSTFDPSTVDLLREQPNRLAKTSVKVYAGRHLRLDRQEEETFEINVIEDMIREQRRAFHNDYGNQGSTDSNS